METTTKPAAKMTRPELVEYLKAHDAYGGLSKFSAKDLRVLVAERMEAPATNRVDRLGLAKGESKALQAWAKAGEKGPRPSTPNLDAITEENSVNGSAKSKSRKAASKPKVTPTVQFYKNGTPIKDSSNKLSSMAYQNTKGIDGKRPRISTAEFLELLAAEGITEPTTTEWSIELPNGIKLETKKLTKKEVAKAA